MADEEDNVEPEVESNEGSSAPPPAPSAAGGSAPGFVPAQEPRSSVLYDPNSGKLDVKKLAVWLGATAAFIVSASVVGTHVTEWTKSWLDIDDAQTRMTSCEERLDQVEGSIPTDWRRSDTPRDPNARLSAALPQIATALRDGQKELHRHERAITRLSTIHEFGLTRTRERAAAVEARQAIGPTGSADAEDPHGPHPPPDPLSSLADM